METGINILWSDGGDYLKNRGAIFKKDSKAFYKILLSFFVRCV